MTAIRSITSALASLREPRGVYVGKIDGADAYVELIVGAGGALAYIGGTRRAGDWAGGRLRERRLCVVSRNGIRLQGEIRRRGMRGTLLLPGDADARSFSARAEPNARARRCLSESPQSGGPHGLAARLMPARARAACARAGGSRPRGPPASLPARWWSA
jgi:hypothetical protein